MTTLKKSGSVAKTTTKDQLYVLDDDKVKTLGQGSFGVAVLTKRKTDGARVVIKRNYGAQAAAMSKNEIHMMQDIVHPNVVRILDHWKTKSQLGETTYNIVMEYCDGKSLKEAIDHRSRREKHGFPEEVIQMVVAQCAYALTYCHAQHILHRDLKADNVLMHEGNIRLCDFGLSRKISSTTDFATTQLGTPHYLPPELVTKSPYNDRADIWSLGILLFELMMLSKPFPGNKMHEVFESVLNDPVPELDHSYSKELRMLCVQMLDKNPTKRPAAAQILELDWAKKVLDEVPLPEDYVEKRKNRQTKAWRRLNVVASQKKSIMYEMIRQNLYVNIRAEPNTKAPILAQLQFGNVIEEVGRVRDPEGKVWHRLTEGYCIAQIAHETRAGELRDLFVEMPEWRVTRPAARQVTPEPQKDLEDLDPSKQAPAEVSKAITQLVSKTVNSDAAEVKEASDALRTLMPKYMDPSHIEHLITYHHETAMPNDDTLWTVYGCDYLKSRNIPLVYLRALRAIARAEPQQTQPELTSPNKQG